MLQAHKMWWTILLIAHKNTLTDLQARDRNWYFFSVTAARICILVRSFMKGLDSNSAWQMCSQKYPQEVVSSLLAFQPFLISIRGTDEEGENLFLAITVDNEVLFFFFFFSEGCGINLTWTKAHLKWLGSNETSSYSHLYKPLRKESQSWILLTYIGTSTTWQLLS